jgi:L-asparaginase II
MAAEPLVRVIRSGLEESVHRGHVAVCDAAGRLVAFAGDPAQEVFIRSCAKPFQAAVALSAIGTSLPDRLVAIMCSSHNGEPVHVRAVRSLLETGGLDVGHLRTPSGWPIDKRSMARARRPRPELHDCSGKHAGMLVASVRSGWPLESYRERRHPLQRRILSAVRRGSGVDRPRVGVDGCGVPVHGMALRSIATMYARLSDPDRLGPLAASASAAASAMRAEPYLVGGRHRDDTALMLATEDVVAKEGAEALTCAVSLTAGIAVAVKIGDGGYRAAGPAMIRVLEAMDVLPRGARRELAREASPPVTGGGAPVGKLVADFDLHRA